MLSISTRSLLTPGVALATVGVLAMSPALVAPPAVSGSAGVRLPAVHIEDIHLAAYGPGVDLYNAISGFIGGTVQWVTYPLYFFPPIGSWVANQIQINYYELIQPLIRNTVYYLSDVVHDPFGFLSWTNSYLVNQAAQAISYINAQALFFGLPPLPPIPLPPVPPLASVSARTSAAPAAGRSARAPRAAAASPRAGAKAAASQVRKSVKQGRASARAAARAAD